MKIRSHTNLIPFLLFVTSTSALILALVFDGVWDVLAWLTLATPLCISFFAWLRPS